MISAIKRSVWLLAAAALVATALAASATASKNSSATGQLVGAGSTFVAPLVSQWAPAYPGVGGTNIIYQPSAPAAGFRRSPTNRRLRRLGCAADSRPARGLQGLRPDPLGARRDGGRWCNVNQRACAASHRPDPSIAKIYLGQITNWNDPAIQALNQGVTLPNLKITPVYRSDGSGTSYNFTDYLSSVSAAWKTKVGVSTQPPFPTGVGGKGSSGVAGVVKNTTARSATPTSRTRSRTTSSSMAVQNAAGKFTLPEHPVDPAAPRLPRRRSAANNEMHIVNPPKSAATAYPISHLHLRHRARRRRRTRPRSEDHLLGADQGQKLGVHARSSLRADPEDRARRGREDAQDRFTRLVHVVLGDGGRREAPSVVPAQRGNVQRIRSPRPVPPSASMSPPAATTTCLTIASPSPVPRVVRAASAR